MIDLMKNQGNREHLLKIIQFYSLFLQKIYNISVKRKKMKQQLQKSEKQEFNLELCQKQSQVSSIPKIPLQMVPPKSSQNKNRVLPYTPPTKAPQPPSVEKEQYSCSELFQEVRGYLKIFKQSFPFRVILSSLLFLFFGSCIMQTLNRYEDIIHQPAQIIEKCCVAGFWANFILCIFNWENQQKSWIVLDLITLSTGVAAFAIEDNEAERYLKAIRTLKLLFFIKTFQKLQKSFNHFLFSWKKVGKVLIPLLIFLYLIAAVQHLFFVDLQYQRCRDPANKSKKQNWTVYKEEIFLCGGNKPCPIVEGIQFECLNPIDFKIKPNPKQLQYMELGYGLMNFSTIFKAIFSTLKQVFLTGSSRVANLYRNVFEQKVILIMYIILIYLIPYIYFGIFYSLLLEDPNEKQDNESEQDFTQNQNSVTPSSLSVSNKSEMKTASLANQRKAEDKITVVSIKTIKKASISAQTIMNQKIQNIFNHVQEIIDLENNEPENKSQKQVDEINILDFLDKIRPFIVFLSVASLSLDFEGQSNEFQYITNFINVIFCIILVVETTFRIIYSKIMNKKIGFYLYIDIILTICCLIGLIHDAIKANSFEEFVYPKVKYPQVFRCCLFLRSYVFLGDSMIANLCKSIFRVTHFILT